MQKNMKSIKSKVLSSLIMTIFLLTSGTLVAHWDNDDEFNRHNDKSHYVQQCTDLPTLNTELLAAQVALPGAEAALDVAQDAYDNATTKAQKKLLKKQLKTAQQLVWDIEGEIKWLNKEIKKLDKFCYGEKHWNRDNWHAWWKNWKDWFSWHVNAWWK